MTRLILLRPRGLAVLVPILLLALCWLALRGNDGSPPPQATASQGHHPVAESPPSPDGELRMLISTQLEEDARARTGAGKPLAPDFLTPSVQGVAIRLPLPDGTTASGAILQIEHDGDGILFVHARIERPEPGTLFIQRQTTPGVAGPFVGHVVFDARDEGWKIEPTDDLTAARFVPRPVDAIICRGMAMPPEDLVEDVDPQFAPQDHPSDIPIPHYQPIIPLQSLPGATGVIYLDFDGEEDTFPGWGYINARPANATNAQIFDVWRRVSEDFQGFNLNITTDRKVFDAAPVGRRQQVIITPTNTAAPGAGGVAYVNSFNWSPSRPCWSFYQTGKNAVEVISHEVGHTLGLRHHGRTSPVEEYYGGHGTGDVGWAPIMGVGYSRNLSQWSKGEYLNANRTSQDDLLIISTTNNSVAYRQDDYGDTLATAGYLEIFPNNSVANEGIIERTGDIDAFRFQTTGGSINLAVNPVTLGPNLDIHAEIVHAESLAVIIENNPPNALNATLNTNLAAGEYLLRVRGTGRGDPLDDGYTNYGSLSTYLITGAVTGGVKPERFSIAENSANGTHVGTVVPRNHHGGAPLTFTLTSGNTGNAFTLDAATGTLTVANSSVLDFETLSTRWDDPAVIVPFVSITNANDPALNETLRVVVQVLDVNEPPTIAASSFTMAVRTASGTHLATATGSDPDRFQLVTFSIADGNADGAFEIHPDTGVITAAAPIDVAQTLTRQLTLAATDTHTPSLTTTTTVGVTVVAHDSPGAPGHIIRTVYENIPGSTIASLTAAPRFPGDPDYEMRLDSFDGGQLGDNYGSTIRGYLIVPATGNYRFRIASDDHGSLLFAANGNPASPTQIASVSGSTNRYEWTKYASQLSAEIPLLQGQICYIEARHKEGTGADHVAVAWTGPLNTTAEVIPGRFLVPFYQNYPPKIPAATLTIRENAIFGQTVGFVTPTDANVDETFTHFEILGGTGQSHFAIDAATGRITVAAPLDIALTPLTLNLRVTDGGSPPLSGQGTITIEITAADAIGTTAIAQEIWSGIPGVTIAALTSHPSYPHSPSSTRLLTSGFDSGTNFGDNYGSRIRALVTPPTTGEYTFYLTTDDAGRLLMGNDSSAAGANTIAEVNGWAGPEEWTKFPSQTSAPRQLIAGQSYYIEALHKEGGGGDHVRVAWTGPGVSTRTIIAASALRPFDINAPPTFTPANYNFTLDATLPIGTQIGTLNASDPEGEPLVLAITAGNEAGHFAINSAGQLVFASADLLFNGIVELSVTAQDGGIDGFYPFKSATATVTIMVNNAGDLDFPVPNPMSWSSPPVATSTSSISMTATTAFGKGGVEYFFECLTPDGQSSGWQDSATFTITGLPSGGSYAYRVKVRDKSPEANETDWSPTVTATLPVRPVIIGGEVAIVDGYITHTFRQGGDTEFILQGEGAIEVDVLIVAGGGGGGSATSFSTAGAGGGGAGGVVYREGLVISQTTPISIGNGGAAAGSGNTSGSNGENSSFGSLIALGGGGGAGGNVAGNNGGSGGGGRGAAGGAAQQPTASSEGFGHAGATWASVGGDGAGGGGGAGAPAPGPNPATVGGPGGAGREFDISGTLTHYAGGGGGGGAGTSAYGEGGNGGGGDGANNNTASSAGAPHTGGGGGGGNNDRVGAPGGSGIVIIRYPVMVDVPFVLGMPQTDAVDAILTAGLVVGAITTQIDDTLTPGTVISQSPTGGTMVAAETAVAIVISLGTGTQGTWAAATSGAWLTATNWADSIIPGSTSESTNTDRALFATGTQATVGIDMDTLSGTYHLGAIHFNHGTNRNIGNSSETTAGTLTLNGTTLNSVANTILWNQGTGSLTLQRTQGANQPMALELGNGTNNIVQITGTGRITIASDISGVGRQLTRQGGGSGPLILSGTNGYDGGTTVSSGTLSFNTLASKATTGTHTFAVGTTLGLGFGGATRFTEADIVNAFESGFTGELEGISIGSTNNIAIDSTGGQATFSANIGPSDRGLEKIFSGQNLTLTGANQYSGRTVVWGGGGALRVNDPGNIGDTSSNVGINSTVDLNGGFFTVVAPAPVSSNRNFNLLGGAVIFGDGSTTNTIELSGNISTETAGAKTVDFRTNIVGTHTFSGVISDGSGTLNIAKSNNGTWILSGANTYTGTTTIKKGILILTGATQATTAITFESGGVLGLNTGVSVTASSAAVDLTDGAIEVTGTTGDASYTLLTANSITGTPVLADPVPGYELQVVGNELLLVESVVATPFETWAGGPSVPFDGDLNGDGVANGLAFLLGASGPNANALEKLPTVSEDAGGLVLTFQTLTATARGTAQLMLEYSTSLASGSWTTVTVPDTAGVTVDGDVTFTLTGTGPLDVTATISAAAADGGKLFGRLKTEAPQP